MAYSRYVFAWACYLISILPFWLIYTLSDILFFVLYFIIGYRKSVVRKNLEKSFPEKTSFERRQIEKQYFSFLCDIILETLKLKTVSRIEASKRFKILNLEELQRHLKKHNTVCVVTAHYANWEWVGATASLYAGAPLLVVYKPQSNKNFEHMLNQIRSRFGTIMVPMRQAFRTIMTYPTKPFVAAFLCDQTPAKSEATFFTPFLNQSTAVFLGVEKIAKKAEAPVVFLHVERIKRGYQVGTFKTLVENPQAAAAYEITKLHTAELERVIKQKPEFWLWSHSRWKFTSTDRTL